jgi:DNA-binding NarL/FixJ family response regulator
MLTPRQMQIVRQLATGQSLKQVASSLGLSHGTMKIYIVKIRRRLGIDSTFQLGMWYERQRIMNHASDFVSDMRKASAA